MSNLVEGRYNHSSIIEGGWKFLSYFHTFIITGPLCDDLVWHWTCLYGKMLRVQGCTGQGWSKGAPLQTIMLYILTYQNKLIFFFGFFNIPRIWKFLISALLYATYMVFNFNGVWLSLPISWSITTYLARVTALTDYNTKQPCYLVFSMFFNFKLFFYFSELERNLPFNSSGSTKLKSMKHIGRYLHIGWSPAFLSWWWYY